MLMKSCDIYAPVRYHGSGSTQPGTGSMSPYHIHLSAPVLNSQRAIISVLSSSGIGASLNKLTQIHVSTHAYFCAELDDLPQRSSVNKSVSEHAQWLLPYRKYPPEAVKVMTDIGLWFLNILQSLHF